MPETVAAVVVLDPEVSTRAADLANRLSVPCLDGGSIRNAKAKEQQRFFAESLGRKSAFIFLLGADGLRLHAFGELNLSIRADFHGAATTYRRVKGGGRGQMIAKAVGFKRDEAPRVLDCTAGLGADAFVLAGLGCEVCMIERVLAVRELLRDGLLQAGNQGDPTLNQILSRMRLVEMDAQAYLGQLAEEEQPDVVYLDPMFPERTKSALVKKEMRIFHELVGDDPDADELLPAALAVARKRVVVKRPRIAPALVGPVPSHVLEGKRNRYDIYVGSASKNEG